MDTSHEVLNLRTAPIQQRSSDRAQALLDGAAVLIDDEGIDGVTTTAVAYRSRSSVGVLYRYFPNIDSLLKALAQRNVQRYIDRALEAGNRVGLAPWEAWDTTFAIYIDMCRHEPGFRHLGFGDIITERFLGDELTNSTVIARIFSETVSEEHNVPVTDTMLFHVDMAVAMTVAIVRRAFLYEPDGDEKFIEKARILVGTYLRTELPLASQ
jgi:AcrR family transcriptional regulator